MRIKLFSFILALLALLILLPKTTAAAQNFTTDYEVIYTVEENANTKATINVSLTNTTEQYYASSYALQVGFKTIQNLNATDQDGKITPSVTKTDDGQIIELNFNNRVVGKGKKMTFTLTFETPDIARNQGGVTEINIPGIKNAETFNSFSVKVVPPPGSKETLYIKPNQKNNSLTFNKEQLGQSGISIAFGTEQNFAFGLKYHLKNSNLFPIKTEVALPPTTNYQIVKIDSINPKPKNVTKDEDGNWLAEYHLAPSQRLDILLKGKVKLSLSPKKEELSESNYKKYTASDKYWETENPEIKRLAKQLKTAENIYDYVVETLNYDFDRVTQKKDRLGAEKTLSAPESAVCLEFTDLFIALARAAGIPAREINGYAYTENEKQRPLTRVEDILHAWPEYYNLEQETWIMVDPTWGSTTGGTDYFHVFDLDHITFVRKGVDSTYPIPAGGYKLPGEDEGKDVQVVFAEKFETNIPKLIVENNFKNAYPSGSKIEGILTVRNSGSFESNTELLQIKSDFLTPQVQQAVLTSIPPFGFREVKVGFDKTSLTTNKVSTMDIILQNDKTSYNTKISPFTLTEGRIIGGIIFGISIIILSFAAFKARGIHFFRREKKPSLRR